jgi:hypothetical protein
MPVKIIKFSFKRERKEKTCLAGRRGKSKKEKRERKPFISSFKRLSNNL